MKMQPEPRRKLIVEITICDDLGHSDEQLLEELNSMFYLSEFRLFPLQEVIDVAIEDHNWHSMVEASEQD